MKQTELVIVCHYTEDGPDLGELFLAAFRGFLLRELEKLALTSNHHVL